MKFGIRWQSVSTWMMSFILKPCCFAQLDQAVEDRLPVLVAREIVVGDEEAADALRRIGAHDRLDVVGRAAARFSPLHVDDGAEASTGRGSRGRRRNLYVPGGALNAPGRQDRRRRPVISGMSLMIL